MCRRIEATGRKKTKMTKVSQLGTGSDRRDTYRRMVSEMSLIPPHELSAIFGIRPRDIPDYCRRAMDETA